MKLYRSLALAAVLGLGGCYPYLTADYTEAEAPKQLTLDNASTQVDLHFAPGSSRLLARDAARLRALVATGGIARADRIGVATSGSPALAQARFETIAAELLRYNIVASRQLLTAVPPNRAIVASERYLVTLPPCPNWSKSAPLDLANAHASNFGCADRVNLGMMVASPADLAAGRPLADADGTPAAAAVNRYLTDKNQLPTAATVGPIAAPGTQTPGAAGGGTGGTTGSTP